VRIYNSALSVEVVLELSETHLPPDDALHTWVTSRAANFVVGTVLGTIPVAMAPVIVTLLMSYPHVLQASTAAVDVRLQVFLSSHAGVVGHTEVPWI